uniref:Uncharacterized protein n=1 Tax=Anguilla anguilla TaxID=7936 RepID=A0A0E9TET4_ANGAN
MLTAMIIVVIRLQYGIKRTAIHHCLFTMNVERWKLL